MPPHAHQGGRLKNWGHWLAFAFFFILAVIIVAVFHFVPLFRPQGFHCNDPDLSHKYVGDTITTSSVVIAAFVIAPIILAAVEYWDKSGTRTRWETMKQALLWYEDFVSGLVIIMAIVVIIKAVVGEPRPHFFDSCKPKEANNCTTGTYVDVFECASPKKRQYQDSSRSFPSGHAAVAFYVFVYMSWYLQKNLNRVLSIVLLWMQTCLFLTACIVAMSRITDHRHHWWDVLVGTFLGCAVAVCSALTLSRNFKVQ